MQREPKTAGVGFVSEWHGRLSACSAQQFASWETGRINFTTRFGKELPEDARMPSGIMTQQASIGDSDRPAMPVKDGSKSLLGSGVL